MFSASNRFHSQPCPDRLLHVSEKLYQDHLRPLSERAAEQNPDFAEFDGTNPFPKILFPRLVTCMRRHEISPYEYDVHVSVHATIAPDSLLEMCSISDDYRRTKILGSIYRDHLSWMDDYSDDEYTPQDGDLEVITDTVRELRFSESGRIASIEEIRDSSHWVFRWEYDGDTGKGSSLLKLDFTNLTIEMEGNCLKQGARATDILLGVWFLMPEHNGDDYLFELVVSVPTWRVAGLTLYNVSALRIISLHTALTASRTVLSCSGLERKVSVRDHQGVRTSRSYIPKP